MPSSQNAPERHLTSPYVGFGAHYTIVTIVIVKTLKIALNPPKWDRVVSQLKPEYLQSHSTYPEPYDASPRLSECEQRNPELQAKDTAKL